MKILFALAALFAATPAFAGFWCNGSESSIYCNAPGGGYWCTGSATSKHCNPPGGAGFWCMGSETALHCDPPGTPGYWCTGGSSRALYCNDGDPLRLPLRMRIGREL